jgi:LuxR family maltose regulon positive regulatory protein
MRKPVETLILSTKLYIPSARSSQVARPRLLEKLQAGLGSNSVLVSAPAGFGKTTLISEWVSRIQPIVPAGWLSLETGENDPIRFWDYFTAALKTLKPAIGETALSLLHSPQPLAIEAVLTTLINDLTSLKGDFVLVLDDYHVIQSQSIHAGITFLLEHMPAKMHLVIATRVDPALTLARFRVKGTMSEIGADDLRFTADEAAGLLKQLQGAELSREDVQALNTRAEGWVAGLKMAALSLGQGKDVKGFIENFAGSQRYIMDYLMEEVLLCQTEEVQEFLLRTSLLERLTAPLCDFVSGHGGSQEMLEKLEHSNLFLVPLDESRQWYRYHHLFGELLRHQFEMIPAANEVALLHRRASQWYEENGLADDAVHHALAAKDWERAVRLLYDPDEKRIKLGETVTLLTWLKAVPEETLRAHPKLYRQFAQVLTNAGEFDAAETVLGYLEKTARDDTNLQGEIALLRAGVAQNRGDYSSAIDLASKALSLLQPDNVDARAKASMLSGSAHFESGLFDQAWSLMTDAYELGRKAADHWIVASALAVLGIILWQRGKLHQSALLYEEAISLAERSPASINPRLSLSYVLYYEWNDLEAAARQQQYAIELSRLSGSVAGTATFLEGRAVAYYLMAHTLRAQGDSAGAKAAAEKSDELAQTPSVARSVRARHAAFRVMLAIWQDDAVATHHWSTQLSEYVDAMPFWLSYVPFRILISCGEKEVAAEQLKALYERTARAKLQTILIRICICQALAAATPDQALTFLAEALNLGQPEGFIRSFVDESRLLAPLLRKALSQGITPEYTGKLLNIIEAEDRQRTAKSGSVTPPLQPSSPLSERELEVLSLLALGLSNRQIAERLIISLSTAKTHVHNISEKMNAKTRTQAIARARELNLI